MPKVLKSQCTLCAITALINVSQRSSDVKSIYTFAIHCAVRGKVFDKENAAYSPVPSFLVPSLNLCFQHVFCIPSHSGVVTAGNLWYRPDTTQESGKAVSLPKMQPELSSQSYVLTDNISGFTFALKWYKQSGVFVLMFYMLEVWAAG